jgi:glycosyltransferase involved in cell wall biosynthesis
VGSSQNVTNKILLVSWTQPPETSGSAVIVGNLAQQFTRDEMVLIGERSHGRPAGAWKEEWPAQNYMADELAPSRRGARWWRRLQWPLALIRTISLARREHCNVVLTVFPKEEHLLIGYLTAMATGARFYPYFHNTYLENRTGLAKRFASWLQGRVFAHAKHVFVVSEGMAALYRKRYPGLSCSALVHTFSEPLLNFTSPPPPASPLRVIVSGNINESCRDAAVRLCRAVKDIPDTALTILTGTPRPLLESLGMLSPTVQYATVSRDGVLQALRSADIVLLPHGFDGALAREEYETIFPTKTIEYLICGRPILAHTPPACFLTQFLRQAHCALVVDTPDASAVITAVQRLRNDSKLRSCLVRNALKTAEQFRASVVAHELRTRLKDG